MDILSGEFRIKTAKFWKNSTNHRRLHFDAYTILMLGLICDLHNEYGELLGFQPVCESQPHLNSHSSLMLHHKLAIDIHLFRDYISTKISFNVAVIVSVSGFSIKYIPRKSSWVVKSGKATQRSTHISFTLLLMSQDSSAISPNDPEFSSFNFLQDRMQNGIAHHFDKFINDSWTYISPIDISLRDIFRSCHEHLN